MGSLIYFTTNPSEYDDLEGVIVSEQDPPGFIEGVDLGAVGIADETLRGPVDTPIAISGEAEFLSIFGHRSRASDDALVNKVWLALARKRFGSVVVVRCAADDAVAAEADFADAVPAPIINVAASSVGAWGNDITIDIEDATDGDANRFNLRVNYRGGSTLYENLDCQASTDNLLSTIGNGHDVLITATKLADGRPANVAGASLADTAGSDGTVADDDFVGAGRGIDALAGYPGLGICFIADRANATINAAIKALADEAVDRMFPIWNGTLSADSATVIADVESYRSDRIIYCWNPATLLDPISLSEVEIPPHQVMASLLSQLQPEQHPSSRRTLDMTRYIRSLRHSPSRGTLKALKEAGICSLEKGTSGFRFRSGVTTSLETGKTEITRRRSADFLQLSAADRLQDFVYEEDTEEASNQIVGELDAFCGALRDAPRMVEDYAIVGQATNADGVKVLRWRVKLLKHMLHLVLETEIGTGVTIEAALAA